MWSSKWKRVQQDFFSSQSKLHSHLLSAEHEFQLGKEREGKKEIGRQRRGRGEESYRENK